MVAFTSLAGTGRNSFHCVAMLVVFFPSPCGGALYPVQFSNQLVSGIIFVQYNTTVEPNVSDTGEVVIRDLGAELAAQNSSCKLSSIALVNTVKL